MENIVIRQLLHYGFLLMLLTAHAQAIGGEDIGRSSEPLIEKRIMGWVENIYLPPSYTKLKAKLDTGATTSSIDARDIEPFLRNGEQWVRFTLQRDGKDAYVGKEGQLHPAKPALNLIVERPVERVVKIKRHNHMSMERYVVRLPVYIAGRHHDAEFSLIDRRKFIYPVLLGRRFLKDIAIVDPGKTFLATVEPPSPPSDKTDTLPVTKPSQTEK